jgi:hypothetical protein
LTRPGHEIDNDQNDQARRGHEFSGASLRRAAESMPLLDLEP